MSRTGKHNDEQRSLDDMFKAAAQDMAGDATSAGDEIWFRLEAKLAAETGAKTTTEPGIKPIGGQTESQDERRRPLFFWWSAAASVVVCLGLFFWLNGGKQVEPQLADAGKVGQISADQTQQNSMSQDANKAEQIADADLSLPKADQNMPIAKNDYLPFGADKNSSSARRSASATDKAQVDQANTKSVTGPTNSKSVTPQPVVVKPEQVVQPVRAEQPVQPSIARKSEQLMELEIEVRPMTRKDQQLLAQEEVIVEQPKQEPNLKPSGSKVVNWLTRMNDLRKGRGEPSAEDTTQQDRPSLLRRLTRE